MPSEKYLITKKEQVIELQNKISAAAAGVIVNYQGITVADDTKLRKDLREAGVDYSVVKNSIVRFAVEGTDLEALNTVLAGSTAIAISNEDPIVAARILQKYADSSKGKFTVKAGFMDGKVMDATEVEAIAKLPSKEALLSMLCSALAGNLRGLAVAINAIVEKKGEEAA